MLPLRDKASFLPEECRIIPWFSIDGDKNLRVNYDLNANSIVYDIGGYEGDWAAAIYDKYKCNIEVFEPIDSFASKIEKRFSLHPKVKVHPFGLSDKKRKANITLDGASSSTNKTGRINQEINLVKAAEFIKDNHSKIDLMKINIEGDEYPLLNHLLASGLVKNIRDLQIQFHIFVPDAQRKRDAIRAKLSKTHYLTYSYPWIWDNWRRKK